MNPTTSRHLTLGLPSSTILDDRDFRRIRDRQRRLLGRPREDGLQALIDDANRRAGSVIRRIEAGRLRPDVPPELRAEVERFRRGPGDHAYVFVELADVPQAIRDAVAYGIRRATNRLAGYPANSADVTPPLATPTIRYFRASRDDERPDFTYRSPLLGRHVLDSNMVDIRFDNRTPAQCCSTAVHEVYHWGGDDRFRRDDDAAELFSNGLVLSG